MSEPTVSPDEREQMARRLFAQGHYDDCAKLRGGAMCSRYCYAMRADSILWGIPMPKLRRLWGEKPVHEECGTCACEASR